MSNDTTAKPDAPPKRSKRSLLLMVAGLVVLLGAGGGAYWMYAGRAEAAEPEAPKEEEAVPPGIVSFEPFVANLANADSRFIRLNLALVVESEEKATHLSEETVVLKRIRSAIIELLAVQTADRLLTPEGKAELKKLIAESAAHVAHDVRILDVLFSEFIVQ